MIVICTHNGVEIIPNLISDLSEYGTNGEPVLIVDSKSDDINHLNYIREISNIKWDFPLIVDCLETNSYESGAIIHAYRNYCQPHYLLLHDSVRITSVGWFNNITKHINDDVDVVALSSFKFYFNNSEQVYWMKNTFPFFKKCPTFGINGGMFYTTRNVLDNLNIRGWLNFQTINKNEACAMERGWSVLFQEAGFKTYYMTDNKFINSNYMYKICYERGIKDGSFFWGMER